MVARLAAEPRPKVSFEIEQLGPIVRLTVVHDGFEPGSEMLQGVTHGWPAILSSLKSMPETGEVLPSGPDDAAGQQAAQGAR